MDKIFKEKSSHTIGVAISLKNEDSRASFANIPLCSNTKVYGDARFYQDVVDFNFSLGTYNGSNVIIGYFEYIGTKVPNNFKNVLYASKNIFKFEKTSSDRVEFFVGYESYSDVLAFFDELHIFATNEKIIINYTED